ncbi:MAG: hypothetical protein IH940_07290 [Acidobacteria bacterium]|nr:hypothetical protein [Acidobacteriota bacterium]
MRDPLYAPAWEQPSDDVAFDEFAALEAAEACRGAAAVAAEAGLVRHQAGVVADSFFRGVFAERFRVQHDDAVDLHSVLAETLAHTANRIEQAAVEAVAEQRRRDVLRDEWEDEYRRNVAAAARYEPDGPR